MPTILRSSRFDNLSNEEIETHLRINKYNNFVLTDAVRPAYYLDVVPKTGFRREKWEKDNRFAFTLEISVSAESLFEVFLELVKATCNGGIVDVYIEQDERRIMKESKEFCREDIDFPVLASALYEFREFICNDGFLSIAVCNFKQEREIRLDDHKILIFYTRSFEEIEEIVKILKKHNISEVPGLKTILDAEHMHLSCPHFAEKLDELKIVLGAEEYYS